MAICTYRYVFSPPKFIWNYFVFIWIPKHKFIDQTQKEDPHMIPKVNELSQEVSSLINTGSPGML